MTQLTRALVLLVCLVACKSEPKPLECPYYWSVEKDGKTTHLLGTMHGGVDAGRLPKHVWADLDRAPAVAIEADITDPSLMAKVQRPSPTLRDELGPVDWSKLEKIIGPAAANTVSGLKPFVAVSMLSLQHMPKVEKPMDLAIVNAGKAKQKRIVFLESIDHQLALLDKHIGVRELRLMLQDPSVVRDETLKLVKAYESGDAANLERSFAAARVLMKKQGYTDAEIDAQEADLLTGRNQAWIEPLEQLHAAGGGFVAVGAGHLVGKGSVNELLAQKGYTVQRTACPKK